MNDWIFYQIYPWSFCDSNGDGVGDLQGIRSKIPYLKELGVTAVWLSPCFQSPMVDNGYDISDYREIDGRVGTREELETLINELHQNGIKIILDFVANHTSDKHVWFKNARKSKDNPYRDYYIWRKTPPNDWQSVFGGSAWEYDEQTQEYYLHSYAVEQPDLNWENEAVRKEMKAIVSFWLDKGVDGFRCDVLDMISKDVEKGINQDGPKLHEYIRDLFDFDKEFFTVGECWSASAENVEKFCGKGRKELTTVFCFSHILMQNGRFTSKKPSLKRACEELAEWQMTTQNVGVTPTLFFENHDLARSVSRFGDEKHRFACATLLGGLVVLHRGIPFLYQGEEIGLTNNLLTDITQVNDVESARYYEENIPHTAKETLLRNINANGRDNARYMLPWTGEKVKSWQAEYHRREEINVEKDKASENSVFAFYKELIALRKREKALHSGSYRLKELNENGYVFERLYENEKITVVASFEKQAYFELPQNAKVLLDNYENLPKNQTPYRLLVLKG